MSPIIGASARNWLGFAVFLALAGRPVIGAAVPDDQSMTGADRSGRRAAHAPVLRVSEPPDTVMLMLPGPARQPVPQAPPKSTVLPEIPATPAGIPDVPAVAPQIPAMPAMIPDVAPAAPQNPALTPPAEAPAIQQTDPSGAGVPPKTPMEAEIDPASPQIRLTLPEDFVKQSALFCQKQIGQWKIADARELLGEPVRQRPAYEDDQKTVSGTIHAFSDPSGRYKELELDFDSLSGVLRSVFVYPPRMTWEECRRLWGGDVTSADAHQGRNFYSYLNRRLDVLVDQTGKVISLGLY